MREYRRMLTVLDAEFGKMPIRALESPKARGVFLDYQDEIGFDHPREADNRLTVLSLVFSHAVDRGKITRKPLFRFDRLYSADRADIIWTEADVTRFMDGAEIDLQRAMILAIHTGQRYGDLIRLRWSDYDGVTIRLKQSKSQKRMAIQCTPTLKRMLDETPRQGPFILTRTDAKPWHTAKDDKALAKAWHKQMVAASFYPTGWENLTTEEKRENLRFNDLRGTAVTLLAEALVPIPGICAITGHSLQSATRILERYMSMTEALSSAAIHLFSNAPETAFANRLQTSNPVATAGDKKAKGNQ
jgi:integrase